MRFRTLAWKENYLELIDQTLLPGKTVYLKCRNAEDAWKAIRTMKVRGAPAIGVTAAFGVYLGVMRSRARDIRQFRTEFAKTAKYIASARPTARNLFSAVEVMKEAAASFSGNTVEQFKKALLKKALEFAREDEALCRAMGRHGARLLKSGDCVLTHCNAGALATAGMGTALSVIYSARQAGKKIEMIATETRPFLQGARLTAWELKENGVPVTLICDNMVGSVMRTGRIKRVIVGADRIAANGDTANKIGTYQVAELARIHKIPFYVAAPSTTFDFSLKTGKEIPIEVRDGGEVYAAFSRPTAPKGVRIFNPAFDVTPNQLISAIITEKGVFRPPYQKSLARFGRAASGTGYSGGHPPLGQPVPGDRPGASSRTRFRRGG